MEDVEVSGRCAALADPVQEKVTKVTTAKGNTTANAGEAIRIRTSAGFWSFIDKLKIHRFGIRIEGTLSLLIERIINISLRDYL